MWRPKRRTEDFSAEIRAHLELETDALKDEGLNAEEAARQARARFGNVRGFEDRFRWSRRASWLGHFVHDAGFAIRQMIKNPAFSVTAVAVLALGMGASVAIFAFVDAALIKPLPYADPQRLMHVTESEAGFARVNISYPDYLDWKRMNTVLSSLDVFTGWPALLATPTGTEPTPGERVSAGFFRTLGVVPVLGRDFHANEEVVGGPNVVMLSYGAWQRRYGARNDVIGHTVRLDGVVQTIIGVLPREFEFAPSAAAEFWMPLKPENHCDQQRDCHYLFGVGRLKEGVTVAAARANMQAIAQQLERKYPDTNRGRGASIEPLAKVIVGDVRPILLLLLSGAGLLLLIACVNVSSLLLVRSESRRREIAVRGALGASQARISRQFATESLLLTSCGVLLGLALADGMVQALRRMISKNMLAGMPYLADLHLNTHILQFAGLLTVLASALFAAAPILHQFASNLHESLIEGGRTSASTLWRRVGGRMVIIELAATMVLLTSAGLLGKSLYRLLHVDVGFDTDHLATLHVRLPGLEFPDDREQITFARRLLDRVESLPGVQSAAVTSLLPVSCNCNTDWVRLLGKPFNGAHITVVEREVSPGFLNTLHVRLLAGRFFTDADDATKPKVVVINRNFAHTYFPGEDPVGKRIGDVALTPASIRQIVGVVEDFKDGSLDEAQSPTEYEPYYQDASSGFVLIARTAQDEHTILPTLASAVHAINLDVGTDAASTMNEAIGQSQAAYFHRSTAYLVGGFAVLALLLSGVGLYGVIAYSVSQRTREIGVRMALGAQRIAVRSMVLREAGRLALLGILLGGAGSVGAGMLLQKLLFGVKAWDVSILAVVMLVLLAATLLASYIPAHRAASLNPVEALRAE
ncbi:MAG TPA: ABC transporter permease [Terracidiphilus sp.]|nr:ABC transporter permease [Terracidiphilus sp.]